MGAVSPAELPRAGGVPLLLRLAGPVSLLGVLWLHGVPTQGEQHELNVSNLLLAAGSWHAGTLSQPESGAVPSLSPLLSSSRCPIPVATVEHSGTVAVWPWPGCSHIHLAVQGSVELLPPWAAELQDMF